MSSAVTCPRCGGPIAARDMDLATHLLFCNTCKEQFPLPSDPVTKPTQAPQPTAAGGAVAKPRPSGAPPAHKEQPLGPVWNERWDGQAWHIVVRRVSLSMVALFVALVLCGAGWAYSQRDLFGDAAMLGVGIGVVIGVLGVMRMARSTYMRLDPRQFVLQQKPTGKGSVTSTDTVERFVAFDESAPGRLGAGYSVGLVPREGVTLTIDLLVHTEAEARFVAERLTEMLQGLRGGA